jgi:eukaryotic-like serine/threonine-protein kinase
VGHGVAPDGATFYAMPLYAGTLRDLIKKGIAADAVLPFFGQLLAGVNAAHLLGVWYRDIKPENVLFSASENKLIIADFGIAHFEENVQYPLSKPSRNLRGPRFW